MAREYCDIGELTIRRPGVETYIAAAVSPDLRAVLDLQCAEDGTPRRLFSADDLTADEVEAAAALLLRTAQMIREMRAARGQMRLRLVA